MVTTEELLLSLETTTLSNSEITIQLEKEAAVWQQINGVQMSDGTIIPVNHDTLVTALRQNPPNIPGLKRLVSGAKSESILTFPANLTQEELSKILAQPNFQWAEKEDSAIQKWWDELYYKILSWFANKLPSRIFLPFGGYGLMIVGMLFLLMMLGFATYMIWSNIGRGQTTLASLNEHEQLTSASALKQAQQFSQAADYRTAVRYLYLSTLLILDENGLMRYDRSLTNREYLRSVSHLPKLLTLLRDVVDVFDRVWYGFQKISHESYQQYEQRVAELQKTKRDDL